MKSLFVGYMLLLCSYSLFSYAAAVPPQKTGTPLVDTYRQYSYKVSGTVIEQKTHVIIPEATLLLKNLTTGQENTYSCDQYGSYTIILDVRNSYLLQATAKGYTPSEKIEFKENSNDPEQIPLKMFDFTLAKK